MASRLLKRNNLIPILSTSNLSTSDLSIRSFIFSIRSFIFSIRSFISSIRSFISSIRSFIPGNSVSSYMVFSRIGSHSDWSKSSI